MKTIVWKSGIIAVFFILSHCVNDPSSTLHPLLSLKEERQNDTTSQVTITTTVSEDYSMYRIEDDTCTLEVTYHAIINGMDSVVIDSVAIANDSAALQAGTFHGIGVVSWVVPEYLIKIDTNKIQIYPDSIQIYGCVSDETKREAYASIMLYGDTTLPEIRY